MTGSAGFIGSHMSEELVARGYEVDGCDLRKRPSGLVCPEDDALYHFANNVTRYDLVVHCAYHVGGRAAIDGVNRNFAKNLQLDAAMFDWAVKTRQKRVLYFSSSAAYPVELQGPEHPFNSILFGEGYDNNYRLREDDVTLDLSNPNGSMPDSNYGWAKLTGERLAADARRNGLNVTVCRPFSGASASQSLDYPFPSIVARARIGDMTVWGDPGQTRDWIDVSDVVSGALAVVESGATDPVNLATGRGVSMRELSTMIFERANPGQMAPDVISVPGPAGVFYRVGDPSRFFKYYRPVKTLEDMIDEALLQ